jgi:predicted lipoprotein with Yx(FWY)xxD motif
MQTARSDKTRSAGRTRAATLGGAVRLALRFTEDTTNTATCTGGCATVWPPLFLPKGTKTAVAGAGVKGLGTTKWSNGKLQVTFHGEPLYRYSLDTAPGQAKGQNVGGTWFVVHPTGSSGTTKPKAPSGGYGY